MNETDTSTRDPAAIEQDIRRTQDEMSRTVDKIGDQLSVRNIVNSLFDKADGNGNVDTRQAASTGPPQSARAGADRRRSDLAGQRQRRQGPVLVGAQAQARRRSPTHSDPHHRDYVSHMERVEWREGEDHLAYQRRRDLARANYLMVERRHDEDDTSFRDRLDQAAEKFRERRQAWAEQGGRATSAATSADQPYRQQCCDPARRTPSAATPCSAVSPQPRLARSFGSHPADYRDRGAEALRPGRESPRPRQRAEPTSWPKSRARRRTIWSTKPN